MEEDKRLVICDRCKKSVPVSDIRFVPKGKDSKTALCTACRVRSELSKKESPDIPKIHFMCARCNYRFNYNPLGRTNLKCPYCGKSDKIEEYRESSAAELLNSSENSEQFYGRAAARRL